MSDTDRIADTPIHLIKNTMTSSDFPIPGSPAYERLRFIYERLDAYDMVLGDAVDDLSDVIERLREEKQYAKSDRLRTIASRLAKARRTNLDEKRRGMLRDAARGWS